MLYQKQCRCFILVKIVGGKKYLVLNYLKVGSDLLGDLSICLELPDAVFSAPANWEIRLQLCDQDYL